MKLKNIFHIIVFQATIITTIFLAGCANEFDFYPDDLSKVQGVDEQLATSRELVSKLESLSYDTWQQQLDDLVNGRVELNYIREQGLRLISYEIIESKNIDKNAPLTSKSLIPFYNNDQINSFIIIPISDVELKHPKIKESLNEFKRIILENYSISVLMPVKINWLYKDYNFETICWVTEKEIIYDDILSNIRIISAEKKDILFSMPRLKSGNESSSNISYHYSTDTYKSSGFFGKTQAEATASITVYGQIINGTKHMTSHSAKGIYWANSGFSADARVNVTRFSTGISGYCEFSYAVMVGGGGGLTLTWNGSGFTLPSGVSGTNGSSYISTSQLK